MDEGRMKFPSNLNYDGKIVREMGPIIDKVNFRIVGYLAQDAGNEITSPHGIHCQGPNNTRGY